MTHQEFSRRGGLSRSAIKLVAVQKDLAKARAVQAAKTRGPWPGPRGHAEEKSLAIYRDLALVDVSGEYEQAMRSFPVR